MLHVTRNQRVWLIVQDEIQALKKALTKETARANAAEEIGASFPCLFQGAITGQDCGKCSTCQFRLAVAKREEQGAMKLTQKQVRDILSAAEETARTSRDSEEVNPANLRRAFCEDWLEMMNTIQDLPDHSEIDALQFRINVLERERDKAEEALADCGCRRPQEWIQGERRVVLTSCGQCDVCKAATAVAKRKEKSDAQQLS